MTEEKKTKVGILYSGGLDSLVTAWLYYITGKYEPVLIHFNYGQYANNIEYQYTKKFAEKYQFDLITLDITNVFSIFKEHSILLRRDIDINTIEGDNESESDYNYVPMRNLILLSYAAGICEINDIHILSYGANLTEAGNYPDNSIRFFRNLDKVFKVSGKQNYRLKLRVPLINLTKTEIIALAIYHNAPLDLSISCYYPDENGKPCNKCGSCILRNNAIRNLGYNNEDEIKKIGINDKVINTVKPILKNPNVLILD